jgi:putative sigma-54 modulation protein
MQISLTFRNFSSSEGIKSYAEKKLKRLKRFLRTDNLEVNLVLAVEKFRYITELNLWLDGERLYSQEEADDIYAAIDSVVDKTERQISRLKYKYPKKRGGAVLRIGSGIEGLEGVKITKSERFYPKPIDVEEAFNQLEISGEKILVFLNAKTNKICVLHRKESTEYELIEPNI